MRKTLKFLVVGVMATTLLAGCGGNSDITEATTPSTTAEESDTTTVSEETETTTEEETTEFTIKDYSNYVSLGEYKGLSVEPIVVTDEEIEERIQQYFRDTIQEGDTVNIDYTGYLDGEAFEGGSAEGDSLTIGSGRFIDGFESGLVGIKIGETVDLNLAFPETYKNNPDMAGKEVVFTVKVNSIDGVVAPEYTLENIKANTEYQTIEEYEQMISEQIYMERNEERMNYLWFQAVSNATISGYPQEEVEAYAQELRSYYEQMAMQYSMDLATLLSANNLTEEAFQAECQEYGESMMNETMVLYSIAAAENMTITDEEYQTEMEKMVESSGMSEEFLTSYYGGEGYIRESMLFTKVVEYIESLAVEKAEE